MKTPKALKEDPEELDLSKEEVSEEMSSREVIDELNKTLEEVEEECDKTLEEMKDQKQNEDQAVPSVAKHSLTTSKVEDLESQIKAERVARERVEKQLQAYKEITENLLQAVKGHKIN